MWWNFMRIVEFMRIEELRMKREERLIKYFIKIILIIKF